MKKIEKRIVKKMPLIPDEHDPARMRYFLYVGPGIKMIVQFNKDENKNIFVTAERNLFQKVRG